MVEQVHSELIEELSKFLKPSLGGADLDGVVLRQIPVAQRDVLREEVLGEVLDYVVQQLEDTKLSYSTKWAIASRVAASVCQEVASDIQINSLNDISKRELGSVCQQIIDKTTLMEELQSLSSISVKAVRNTRRTMEDRHVIIPDLNSVAQMNLPEKYEYYAVFDGHLGRDAANYCAAHLHIALAKELKDGVGIPDAIKKTFALIDQRFCASTSDVRRKAGSTAVIALVVDHKKLYVGWLGDAEAVLARDGSAESLVTPHNAANLVEQERIRELGGEIVEVKGVFRLNGTLAVTRAIGDLSHKPFVSNEADVKSVELDETCDFIVLGSDGLFDLLPQKDVIANGYHAALARSFDSSVAEQLCQTAIARGSTDNITTVVVNLVDPKKWHFESVKQPTTQDSYCVNNGLNKTAPTGSSLENTDSDPSLTDKEPVEEVAADFVSSTVALALDKVNVGLHDSVSVEEQGTSNGDVVDSDRLNPLAPEFVPDMNSVIPANIAVPPCQAGSMPKSESRDELVYEVDREMSQAPQPVKAELINLDSTGQQNRPPKAPEDSDVPVQDPVQSDSDDELNSMVVHEEHPQPNIPLGELIVRDQHIHVIPEESPSDEQPLELTNVEMAMGDIRRPPLSLTNDKPAPDGNVPTEKREAGVSDAACETTAPVVNDSTNIPMPTEKIIPAGQVLIPEQSVQIPNDRCGVEEGGVPTPFNEVEGVLEKLCPGSVKLDLENNEIRSENEDGPLSEDLVDLASQVLDSALAQSIEASGAQSAACIGFTHEPSIKVETDYLLSGVHEEAIVPRSQPLMYEDFSGATISDEPSKTSLGESLIEALETLTIEEKPKIIDTIEKKCQAKDNDASLKNDSCPSFELSSVKDIMEKLSTTDPKTEEPVGVPQIPDSVPEAEGVQDLDSESDENDVQEWSFVKPANAVNAQIEYTTVGDTNYSDSKVKKGIAEAGCTPGVQTTIHSLGKPARNTSTPRTAKVAPSVKNTVSSTKPASPRSPALTKANQSIKMTSAPPVIKAPSVKAPIPKTVTAPRVPSATSKTIPPKPPTKTVAPSSVRLASARPVVQSRTTAKTTSTKLSAVPPAPKDLCTGGPSAPKPVAKSVSKPPATAPTRISSAIVKTTTMRAPSVVKPKPDIPPSTKPGIKAAQARPTVAAPRKPTVPPSRLANKAVEKETGPSALKCPTKKPLPRATVSTTVRAAPSRVTAPLRTSAKAPGPSDKVNGEPKVTPNKTTEPKMGTKVASTKHSALKSTVTGAKKTVATSVKRMSKDKVDDPQLEEEVISDVAVETSDRNGDTGVKGSNENMPIIADVGEEEVPANGDSGLIDLLQ